MFKFFKDKIKQAIANVTKKVEKEAVEETEEKKEELREEEIKEEIKEKEKPKKEKKKLVKKVEKEAVAEIEETKEEFKEEPKEEEKKSLFKRLTEKITLTKISGEKFNEIFHDMEIALLENNVAEEVVERIKSGLEKDIINNPIKRNKVSDTIIASFRNTLEAILSIEKINVEDLVKNKKDKPFVFLFLGYNGVGKSLTIGKVARFLKDKNFKVILAAGDTFRAAGSSQLVEYANKVNVPVIKGKTGSDSCSIIFDTITSAKAKNYDVVLADTAGRIHNNPDLINELKKIVRVNKPDYNILVIDAMTGSDVVQQAEEFNKHVNIDALIITKIDTYEKAGTLLSAAYLLKKPILFLGVGQESGDLKEYDKDEIIKSFGL
ncbi:signal recognition particle-docking protein FtsY [Candidatus Woesearchaeota archaeon]|nr:signal recognition particle-docking protein FtsY [Candidatus Woesearchaeota archaeon]